METKICSFCGMEYPASEEKCPLCGHNEVLPDEESYGVEETPQPRRESETRRPRRRTGARVAPSSSPIPKWLVVLTCLILALAVVIFVLFLLSRAGVFDVKPADSGSVTLPMDDPEKPADGSDDTDDTDASDPSGDANTDADVQPDPVLCTGLTMNRTEITPQAVGDRIALSATPEPADTTDEIIWSSSNPMVCSVSDDGTVMVVAPGDDVTISAMCGAMTATCVVKTSALENAPEQSDPDANHSISAEDITFFSKGESTKLRLSNTKDGDEITWKSDDESIATVTDGVVQAVGRGTTNVTATLSGKTYTCIVRCNFTNDATAESGAETAESGTYQISHEDVTLHYLEHESFRLTLGGYEGSIVWTSSDTSVCTTDGSIVTAQGAGTAKVTAIVGSTTYTCIVRCIE